jgi:Leucine rich repeat
MTSLWQTSEIYVCTAKMVLVGVDLNITEASRNHLPGKNDSDVQGVNFNSQILKTMPQNLGEVFPNLSALVIYNAQIEEIQRRDLIGFPNLKMIRFYYNQIKSIDGDLFEDLPQIEHISFQNNPLKHVGVNAFDNLKNLQSLYLYSAGCISSARENNQVGVQELISQLTDQCPPSWKMIIAAKEFKAKIEEQIEAKTDPLASRLSVVEQILMGYKSVFSQFEKKMEKIENTVGNNPKIELL